uniref:XK-related protein n=1 Tax=Syphacia muris TaxID=451379 RepID=A0A0N5AA32_9BILA
MVSCMVIMVEFLFRSRYIPKLEEPHEIPIPALIGAISLSIGVAVGFFYLLIFNYAFRDCDKLVDVTYGSELYLDAIYSLIMILFTLFSLCYILQRFQPEFKNIFKMLVVIYFNFFELASDQYFFRRYYGAINSNLDRVSRLYINITFCIVWIKVVIYKGYLSHEELCQRHELEDYWCPVLQRDFQCEPDERLHGTQKIWYYLHKGLLNIAVMSCASEIYPVLLISHWLSCGNAEETAEHLIKKQQRGVRSILRQFVSNISTVHAEAAECGPPLRVKQYIKTGFNLLTALTTGQPTLSTLTPPIPEELLCTSIYTQSILMILRWLILFYYSMDYNNLWPKHWITNDAIQMVAFFVQMIFFISVRQSFIIEYTVYCYLFIDFFQVYLWSRRLRSHRLDAHHKASARGDVIILFGCCVFLLAKFILQILEDIFQYSDSYYNRKEAIFRIMSRIFIHVTLWVQYLAIRKILAISNHDAKATKQFLSFIALAGCLLGWIHFGCTFLETTIIHFQLDEEKYGFSQSTLMTMIFTQTLFPADYLYGFTVAGCWLEVIIRYIEFGFFQLGEPHLEKELTCYTHDLASPTRLISTDTLMTPSHDDEFLRYRYGRRSAQSSEDVLPQHTSTSTTDVSVERTQSTEVSTESI